MGLDALLAIGHHIAAFAVLATLAAEWALVRPGLTRGDAARLGSIDATYGIAAAAVVLIGIARLYGGAMPGDFFTSNPIFWTKMAIFGAIGLISIGPTMTYIRWARAASSDATWAPPAAELASTRRALVIELALFPLIPACAALMARGVGA